MSEKHKCKFRECQFESDSKDELSRAPPYRQGDPTAAMGNAAGIAKGSDRPCTDHATRVHVQNTHDNAGASPHHVVCEHCGEELKGKKNLQRHRNVHMDPAEYPFSCYRSGCGERFPRKDSFASHMDTVHGQDLREALRLWEEDLQRRGLNPNYIKGSNLNDNGYNPGVGYNPVAAEPSGWQHNPNSNALPLNNDANLGYNQPLSFNNGTYLEGNQHLPMHDNTNPEGQEVHQSWTENIGQQ
ncbi:hypothetical protein VTJ49DRAFT_6658 [Mycothermus thermophilus]|uniref:C2H2-type domain-containing protein n=1 Tax=Humicola insolens TaxID=85995 RepID=A0ABR3VIV9_HUMIN